MNLRTRVARSWVGDALRKSGLAAPLKHLHLATVRWRGWHRATIAGIPIDVRVTTEEELARASGEFEVEFLQRVADHTASSDVFWDIGANIGVFSVLAAKRGATTVAVEPERTNVQRVAENAQKNGVSIKLIDKALGSTPGTASLAIKGGAGAGGHTLLASSEDDTQSVDVVRGEDLLAFDVPRPTSMKIDVEGFEFEVLSGLGGLMRGVNDLFIELHPRELQEQGRSIDEIDHLLSSAGLECVWRMPRGGQIHAHYARRKDSDS